MASKNEEEFNKIYLEIQTQLYEAHNNLVVGKINLEEAIDIYAKIYEAIFKMDDLTNCLKASKLVPVAFKKYGSEIGKMFLTQLIFSILLGPFGFLSLIYVYFKSNKIINDMIKESLKLPEKGKEIANLASLKLDLLNAKVLQIIFEKDQLPKEPEELQKYIITASNTCYYLYKYIYENKEEELTPDVNLLLKILMLNSLHNLHPLDEQLIEFKNIYLNNKELQLKRTKNY